MSIERPPGLRELDRIITRSILIAVSIVFAPMLLLTIVGVAIELASRHH